MTNRWSCHSNHETCIIKRHGNSSTACIRLLLLRPMTQTSLICHVLSIYVSALLPISPSNDSKSYPWMQMIRHCLPPCTTSQHHWRQCQIPLPGERSKYSSANSNAFQWLFWRIMNTLALSILQKSLTFSTPLLYGLMMKIAMMPRQQLLSEISGPSFAKVGIQVCYNILEAWVAAFDVNFSRMAWIHGGTRRGNFYWRWRQGFCDWCKWDAKGLPQILVFSNWLSGSLSYFSLLSYFLREISLGHS